MPSKEQIIKLSNEDRKLIKSMLKWMRFFPIMYLVLWIVMCTILFAIFIVIFGSR
ncbi:hypothetical protein KY306_03175 [Candidatus Woesearchaeota archaeon]|nr:hypothetical protein [Candidatus Woesearchaeota archaeon]